MVIRRAEEGAVKTCQPDRARPRGRTTGCVATRVPLDELERLRSVADERGTSVSALVRTSIAPLLQVGA